MGGGGKGGTTTQTVSIPPEVLARYNAVNARAETVAQRPFQQYGTTPEAFVAPLTPTQMAGIQNTNLSAGAAQPFYQAGAGLTMQGAQGVGPLTQQQIAYYQNPFTQSVVDPTKAALQQEFGQQRSAQQAAAIRAGAFGGDRAGLERANLMRQQGLGMAQAISPLYQQGYQQAVQTAAGQQGVIASDLQRQLAAGQQIAGLGTGAQAAALQGAQAQLAAGQMQQQTEQAGKAALYNQFLQEQGYPFQVAQFLANIAMGTGALSGSTTTTQQPGGFFSDRRLKEDVKEVGKTFDGQPVYTYKYKGDDTTQMGLMAQDVEKRHPEAVGLAAGYKTVNYDKATENSEGGAVTPERAGLGFAMGGSAGFDQDMVKALLQAQQQQYGMYGMPGTPHGMQGTPGTAGRVPQASLPVGKLATPAALPRQQQGGIEQAAQIGKTVSGLASGAKEAKRDLFGGVGEGGKYQKGAFQSQEAYTEAAGKHAAEQAAQARAIEEARKKYENTPIKDVKVEGAPRADLTGGSSTDNLVGGGGFDTLASGPTAEGLGAVAEPAAAVAEALPTEELLSMFAARGGRIGYAEGGDADEAEPIKAYKTPGLGIDIPDESRKNELMTAKGGGGGGGGGLGSALGTAASVIGAGKAVASAVPAILGFFASDKRVKENIVPIGKTHDGQTIYKYNYKGDDASRIGLIAQEVEKKRPEAVAEIDGMKMVDYDRAVRSKKAFGGPEEADPLFKRDIMPPSRDEEGFLRDPEGYLRPNINRRNEGVVIDEAPSLADRAAGLKPLDAVSAAFGSEVPDTSAASVPPAISEATSNVLQRLKETPGASSVVPRLGGPLMGAEETQGLAAATAPAPAPTQAPVAETPAPVAAPDGLGPLTEVPVKPAPEVKGVSPLAAPATGLGAAPAVAAPQQPVRPSQSTDREIIDRALRGSEGTGKNPLSSAQNDYQFIDSTFVSQFRKSFPDLAQGKSDAEILGLRGMTLPDGRKVELVMGRDFTDTNAKTIQSLGLPVTGQNIKIMHFFGDGEGQRVLTADPSTPLSDVVRPAVFEANPYLRGMTVGQAREWAANTMDRAGGIRVASAEPKTGLAAALPSEQRASPFRTLTETAFPDVPEALKSEKLIVPLLGGLAAMLASNKPNLGQALGEGLAGALSAYSDMYTRAPQVEGIEAGTERTRVETNAASFFTDREGRGRVTYRAPDGSIRTMDLVDWIGLQDKPPLDPRSERLAREYAASRGIPFEPARGGLGAAAPAPAGAAAPAPAPATGLGAAAPAPAAAPAGVIALPAEVATDAQRRAKELYAAGTSAVASLPGVELMKQQTETAKAAQDIRPQQATLATSIAALPLDGSLLTPGEPARIFAPVAATLNGLARAASIPVLVNPEDLASVQGIDKIKNQLAQSASSASGQRAYQAFNEIMSAIPSNINSREGAARLLAEMYVVNQREIDRENFFRQYRDTAAGPNGAYRLQANALGGEADAAFNRLYPPNRYNEEKAAIIRMMQTSPGNAPMNDAGRPMSWLEYMHKYGSTLSPEQQNIVRETFKKESPNVLRFFGIGG